MSNTTTATLANAAVSDAETPFARSKEALFALGDRIVRLAKERGADVAEAVISEGSHLSAKVRLGAPELVEEAGSRSIGVRVMVGAPGSYKVAVSYSSDTSDAGINRLVEDAVELAWDAGEADDRNAPHGDLEARCEAYGVAMNPRTGGNPDLAELDPGQLGDI